MLAFVQLDDEATFKAAEVGDVRADRLLTAEPAGENLAIAQLLPEPLLGGGRVATQLTGAVAKLAARGGHTATLRRMHASRKVAFAFCSVPSPTLSVGEG